MNKEELFAECCDEAMKISKSRGNMQPVTEWDLVMVLFQEELIKHRGNI